MAKPKPKKKKPKMDRTEIWHEGKKIDLPVLSAPVGPETPAVKAKYPRMNQPKDVEVIDYYLSAIEAVKSLTPSQTMAPDMAQQRLLGIVQKNIPWQDRGAAIRALQAECAITDAAEKADGLILPGKDTLKALVDLGDVAEKLLGSDETPASKYMHSGPFDRAIFAAEYASRFHGHVAPHGLLHLLGLMERDPYVMDIRWMAYMFATATIETGGKFKPVEEKGHGKLGKYKKGKRKGQWNVKDYYLPVKVKMLPDGRASVIESDGEQFTVSADGASYTSAAGAVRGAEAVNPATQAFNTANAAYSKDKGVEHAYFGRGYCQLTWWDNYASAGHILGRKLDFLMNPDLVLEPAVAYQIMSVGMRTGKIFANDFKISRFISGGHCDYLHARQMVNGMSGAQEIADLAVKFEGALLAAKFVLLAGN